MQPQVNQGAGYHLDARTNPSDATFTTFVAPYFESNRNHNLLLRKGHGVPVFGGYSNGSGGAGTSASNGTLATANAVTTGATTAVLGSAVITPGFKVGDHVQVVGCTPDV